MVGKTISHYHILEKLGEGGMGVVYRAEDVRLERQVALKFLHPEATRDPDSKARFLREAQAAAALDHPNICTVHEIDEDGGQMFLVMAFVEGETLRQKIARRPLPLGEAIELAAQIGEGLRTAHDRGIVHRDIKSANIMITGRGQPKVMDFGLAHLAGKARLTRTGSTVGTPAYMSPEQASGKEVDRRSDIWSLGVVFYEMITGRLPFEGDHDAAIIHAVLNKDPEPLTALRSGVPVELDRVVSKALEKSPRDRYGHVEEMVVDLRRLQRDTQSGAALTAVGRRRRRWWAPAGAATALILSAIAAWNLGWFSRSADAPVPSLNPRQLTANPPGNFVSRLAISPDGKYLAYSDLDGIYLRIVESGETRKLPVPEGMCFR